MKVFWSIDQNTFIEYIQCSYTFSDPDECLPDNPCLHGICTPGKDAFSCTCHPGYSGILCDIGY